MDLEFETTHVGEFGTKRDLVSEPAYPAQPTTFSYRSNRNRAMYP